MTFYNTFVISDTHFGHARIIELANRPFNSVDEMDHILIESWNNVVGTSDDVIFGGDFMFHKKDTGIFDKLNGRKLLILGNHDHSVTHQLSWTGILTRYETVMDGKKFVIDHYPLQDWNNRYHGSIHLYGHTHKTLEPEIENRHCICVECQDYRPKNIKEFIK